MTAFPHLAGLVPGAVGSVSQQCGTDRFGGPLAACIFPGSGAAMTPRDAIFPAFGAGA